MPTRVVPDLRRRYPTEWGLFLFLSIIAATPLALHLHQEQIRMVRSNKEARKRPTESNGTPAMDLGLGTDHVRRYRVLFCFCFCLLYHPRRCKTNSVGGSAGLLIPRLSVRFRQKLTTPRTQIYMDLSYIDFQVRVLHYCFK